jgi:hypothetical protein
MPGCDSRRAQTSRILDLQPVLDSPTESRKFPLGFHKLFISGKVTRSFPDSTENTETELSWPGTRADVVKLIT